MGGSGGSYGWMLSRLSRLSSKSAAEMLMMVISDRLFFDDTQMHEERRVHRGPQS